ncbi:hypothetical protein ALC53_12632 [Atta colombica]|uniref:Transposable element P transposase-like RNase H domain-containing protein n=1 Tax=Atta colombica TaxID=520822 RepID=A0A151HYY6_9HYME|nr:hypothetical protein ALC53_12632 [Atta colombica]
MVNQNSLKKLSTLKSKVKNSEESIICNIVINEMAIQQVTYDDIRHYGLITLDINRTSTKKLLYAKNALVFLAIFIINVRSRYTCSFTFDDAIVNLKMCKCLGANFDIIYLSRDVIKVTSTCENIIRQYKDFIFQSHKKEYLYLKIFNIVCFDVFLEDEMSQHILSQNIVKNKIRLIKAIIKRCVNLRLFYEKYATNDLQKYFIR